MDCQAFVFVNGDSVDGNVKVNLKHADFNLKQVFVHDLVFIDSRISHLVLQVSDNSLLQVLSSCEIKL